MFEVTDISYSLYNKVGANIQWTGLFQFCEFYGQSMQTYIQGMLIRIITNR